MHQWSGQEDHFSILTMSSDIGIRLGERIKHLREAKGMTQAQLATALGKSIETISNFERGKTIPSVRTLEHVANVLGQPIGALFEGESSIQGPRILSKHASRVANAAEILPEQDLEILAGVARVLEGRKR